jgi:hypothetical protein
MPVKSQYKRLQAQLQRIVFALADGLAHCGKDMPPGASTCPARKPRRLLYAPARAKIASMIEIPLA